MRDAIEERKRQKRRMKAINAILYYKKSKSHGSICMLADFDIKS
jgi:hypothetical protein